jgi:tetratricopeptide (TPR) repeat protein
MPRHDGENPADTAPPPPTSPADSGWEPIRKPWPQPADRWYMAVLVFLIALAYIPALKAGFIWDDDGHLTPPALRTWHGLSRIWLEPGATQQYYPLLHSLFWLEQAAWGDAAVGYHVVNLLLHGLTACLFGVFLRRIQVPGAWLAAAIFALHPVAVESVAWITEQKNTLSAAFYLAAALTYVRFHETRRASFYWAATALFLSALLSKTVTATLPAALLVVLWWRSGRIEFRRDVVPLLPWLVLATGAGLFTAWAERNLIGAQGAAFELTALQRLLLSGRVVWFYLGKLIWPAKLMFFYPRWEIAVGSLRAWIPLLAWVGLAAFGWGCRRRSRAPFAVLLLFTGTLFPVLGYFNVFPFMYSFVADHFQYHAMMAPIALAAAGLAAAPSALSWRRLFTATALLVAFGVTTFRQTTVYRNETTLWQATLALNPDCWAAYNNLGKIYLADKARLDEATGYFQRAIDLHPEYPEALNNLGLALTQKRRPAEAIPYLEAAIRLKPKVYQAHNNLGIALASSGRAEESLAAFQHAAELNPQLANIQENWGKALQLLGRTDEANGHFVVAAKLRAGAR